MLYKIWYFVWIHYDATRIEGRFLRKLNKSVELHVAESKIMKLGLVEKLFESVVFVILWIEIRRRPIITHMDR